jgi:excisionase family DNA binding protein
LRPDDLYRQRVPADRLMTSAEVAAWLGVSRRAISKWVQEGRLKPTVTLPGGGYRFDREDVRRQLGEAREGDG